MKLRLFAPSVLAISLLLPGLQAGEADIVDISQRNPRRVYVHGQLAKYGDPDLADAVAGLADIPRPWTVPKIISIFEAESAAWLSKMKETQDAKRNQMWNGWEAESKRLGRLAMLLAASRDPRAAISLEGALDSPNHAPGAGIRALTGLHDYFLSDPRYYPIPEASKFRGVTTNALWEWETEVKLWRDLNDADLKALATKAASAGETTQ